HLSRLPTQRSHVDGGSSALAAAATGRSGVHAADLVAGQQGPRSHALHLADRACTSAQEQTLEGLRPFRALACVGHAQAGRTNRPYQLKPRHPADLVEAVEQLFADPFADCEARSVGRRCTLHVSRTVGRTSARLRSAAALTHWSTAHTLRSAPLVSGFT